VGTSRAEQPLPVADEAPTSAIDEVGPDDMASSAQATPGDVAGVIEQSGEPPRLEDSSTRPPEDRSSDETGEPASSSAADERGRAGAASAAQITPVDVAVIVEQSGEPSPDRAEESSTGTPEDRPSDETEEAAPVSEIDQVGPEDIAAAKQVTPADVAEVAEHPSGDGDAGQTVDASSSS